MYKYEIVDWLCYRGSSLESFDTTYLVSWDREGLHGIMIGQWHFKHIIGASGWVYHASLPSKAGKANDSGLVVASWVQMLSRWMGFT